MSDVSRRAFLDHSARAVAGVSAGLTVLANSQSARAYAANDAIMLGVIGAGGRGRDHGRNFAQRPDVKVKWVCDPDLDRVGQFPDQLERLQKAPVEGVQDLRRVLEDPEVDGVVVATCDHWHGPAMVWACQAGKDVYVEKPASHNVWEGRKMVEAAEKYGRVVQVGTQNRSAPYIQKARAYIDSGELGKVTLVKVYNLKSGTQFVVPEDMAVPEGVDYDLYLGPAPKRPFNRAHFHDGWKKFWAYSGGDMGDDGAHQLDIARYLIGDPDAPKAVCGGGGVLAFDDPREVPDTQAVVYEYPDRLMTFELTQHTMYMDKTPDEIRNSDAFPYWPTNSTRIEVYGTKGLMYVGRHGGGWQVVRRMGEVVAQEFGREESARHRDNWIQCIRSREKPVAHMEVGHRSALLIHLGNLATRLDGRRLAFDAATETITNDEEANNNELRRRAYREPYVIPEQV